MTEGAGAVHYGPGDTAPRSGLYRATSGEKADVALSEGETFPPLEVDGARWVLFQATEPAAAARDEWLERAQAARDDFEETLDRVNETMQADPSDAIAAIEELSGASYQAALNELIRAARTASTTPELPTARHLRAQRDLRHAVQAYDRLLVGYDVETSVEVDDIPDAAPGSDLFGAPPPGGDMYPPVVSAGELEETAAELAAEPHPPTRADYSDEELTTSDEELERLASMGSTITTATDTPEKGRSLLDRALRRQPDGPGT